MYYPQGRAITAKMNRERSIAQIRAPIWTCGIHSKFMKLITMRENILLDSKRLSTLNTNVNVYTISRRLRSKEKNPLTSDSSPTPTYKE